MQAMIAHSWPGNVRELQNFVERAVILSEDGVLRVPPFRSARINEDTDFGGNTLEEMDRDYILRVLDERDWVVGGPVGAAQHLGLKRTTLISKMKRLGISHARGTRLNRAGRASQTASLDQPENPRTSSASLVRDVA